ncbi:FtsJ-domain-containing protein [Violaceomyces palustris]|uniref:FtsJ-domain-containing protein n=1 Tax=Violaceomyces palustris TaxID=1673888 RepID=A0ACD0NUS9_9BASI|nr:FtsJ-domain-containing protein [Violaceomyces palustris]
MGRKNEKKTAKGRLDKFYWLAKEQGYRSRAAFKLVQLNKKFNFLENARCCIDLCAAPGGWLQVASKHMPPNSLIVGVDLVPIKPIPRCITFAEDINSYKCRDQLRHHLKDWKADIVIHDGAPNVGTAWVQDAYAQSELTLQSLKLAVEFLAPGGTFVTKVFRSKDYNNLLWVFNQLFKRVEATKPASSRNVSAEIFVVCQDFKAPSRIDPKFLDPRHVFKDLEPVASAPGVPEELKGTSAGNAHANVFEPKKVRRNREGYADGDYTLFKSIDVSDFLRSHDVIGILGTYNKITFLSDEAKQILSLPVTDEDIKVNCDDLRVLGKKDFRNLMKWRKEVREHLGLDAKANQDLEEQTETVEVEPMDEEEQIDEELTRLNEEAARRARKERRRKNEIKQKTIMKMQLQMTTPMDIGMELTDAALQDGSEDFFDLGTAENRSGTKKLGKAPVLDDDDGDLIEEDDDNTLVSSADPEADENEPVEDEDGARIQELEGDMDEMYDQYRQRMQERDAKFRAKEARRKDPNREEWHGIREEEDEDGDDSDASSEGGWDVVQKRKEQEETYDTDDEEDDADDREDEEIRRMAAAARKGKKGGGAKRKRTEDDDGSEEEVSRGLVTNLESRQAAALRQTKEAAVWFDNPLFKELALPELQQPSEDHEEEEEEEEEESEESDEDEEEDVSESDKGEEGLEEEDDFEVVKQVEDIPEGEWDHYAQDEEAVKQSMIKDHGLTTAEAITLAQALVNRQKTKSDLIDDGFTKHNFVDKNDLPSWFLDDEQKHYKANIPITKEAVEALRARQRALDARPIKKIAEAKARKKYKAAQRLEKAMKKADIVNENEDITEKEKSKTINSILSKSGKPIKKKEIQLVVAKGVNRGLKGRPKGTKGRYKMVDARMKKEMRAQRRINKRDGKKSSGSRRPSRPMNGYSK